MKDGQVYTQKEVDRLTQNKQKLTDTKRIRDLADNLHMQVRKAQRELREKDKNS